jgi:hypothetical protein
VRDIRAPQFGQCGLSLTPKFRGFLCWSRITAPAQADLRTPREDIANVSIAGQTGRKDQAAPTNLDTDLDRDDSNARRRKPRYRRIDLQALRCVDCADNNN